MLKPRLFPRVWGGERLREVLTPELDFVLPLGEVWAVHGELAINNGPYASCTLDELWQRFPREMGGQTERTEHFPLLVKWLDTADWLSLQVHPDDRQAQLIEGSADARGKVESWYVTEVSGEGQLICGCRPGVDIEQAAEHNGRALLPYMQYQTVKPDDFLFVPAGTIHALGPGITVLEVQQSSDITYRFYDWDRQHIAGVERSLHLAQARQACCRSERERQFKDEHGYPALGQLLTANSFFAQDVVSGQVSGKESWVWRYDGLEIIISLYGRLTVEINGCAQVLETGGMAVIPAAASEAVLTAFSDVRFMRVMCPVQG